MNVSESACQAAAGAYTISNDILGPGIILGYICLLISTICVICNPRRFDGPTNATACQVSAVGFAIGSVISVRRHDAEVTDADILFACFMSNFALIMGSISNLTKKRAGVPTYAATFSSVISVLITVMDVFATATLGQNPFYAFHIVLLVLQFIFIVVVHCGVGYRKQDHFVFWGPRKRRVHGPTAMVLLVVTLGIMIYVSTQMNVDLHCNWFDFTYGQIFNAAVGVAGLIVTFLEGCYGTKRVGLPV